VVGVCCAALAANAVRVSAEAIRVIISLFMVRSFQDLFSGPGGYRM
jgi:hypothetical protein